MKKLLDIFAFAKDNRTMTSRWQGTPYFRQHGRELVFKTAILLVKSQASTVEWHRSRQVHIWYCTPAVQVEEKA